MLEPPPIYERRPDRVVLAETLFVRIYQTLLGALRDTDLDTVLKEMTDDGA